MRVSVGGRKKKVDERRWIIERTEIERGFEMSSC